MAPLPTSTYLLIVASCNDPWYGVSQIYKKDTVLTNDELGLLEDNLYKWIFGDLQLKIWGDKEDISIIWPLSTLGEVKLWLFVDCVGWNLTLDWWLCVPLFIVILLPITCLYDAILGNTTSPVTLTLPSHRVYKPVWVG